MSKLKKDNKKNKSAPGIKAKAKKPSAPKMKKRAWKHQGR